ncbi:hypothetical protein G9A89_009697 [Geosiphon pyriformis]|nr:hypothetical protein G9A89_009697 [Geosiphon pyriformis]
MVKKTKSSEKWGQLLVSTIVTPNPFVVPNEILDKISIVLFSTSSKIDQDQPLAVLPNVVSSNKSSPVLEAKQSLPVGSSVFGNWADQMETDSSPSLVASTLVSGATFKIKLVHVKTVFQSSLEAVFLVELTSSVHLATLKIAKSLVVSESGSFSAAVVLCDVLLGVFTANVKLALSVFGSVTCVVLKPAGIWQYVVVYFEKLDSAVSALKHWSVLVDKNSVRILFLVNQNETILSCDKFKTKLVNLPSGCTFALVTFDSQGNLDSAVVKTEMGHLAMDCKIFPSPTPKIPKVFKSRFVGSASYAKTAAPSGLSEFPPLVALLAVSAADPAVGSRLDSLEKQISDLAALVKSIVESVGSLVALVSCFLDNNVVKANAANNFADLMVGVSKNIACLRSKIDFGDIDYDGILAAKFFFLSKNTVEHVIALWQMSGAETRSNIESIRLFFSKFIFDSRNLNGIIERIHGLELFSLIFDSV